MHAHPVHAGGLAAPSGREPGDVWVTRLGIRRLSPARPPVVVSWTLAPGADADGTTLATAVVEADGDEAWRSTVVFRDGAAWTDDVTQVPELAIPRSVFDEAGRGALVELTGDADGTSEVLCVLGFGDDAKDLPASPRVDW